MSSRKKSAHTDSSEYKTFTEVSSEPWPAEASAPYIRHYPDPEDSDIGKALSYSELLLAITPSHHNIDPTNNFVKDSLMASF